MLSWARVERGAAEAGQPKFEFLSVEAVPVMAVSALTET